MTFQPHQDRVLIRRTEPNAKTQGGLFIPEAAKERPVEGVVVAVGPGKRLDNGALREVLVKVGDRVLFSKYSGSEHWVDGVEHLVVREDEILGVIR